MDLNPHRVRSAEFKTIKRGLDPEEVRRFLGEVADALETAQNQSTAMEARARAAVARLQELSDDAGSQATSARSDDVAAATAEQTETISRTLLLAQRTADTAIAQAEAESQRLVAAATEEASATLDSTREMAALQMEEARDEARKIGESERLAIASEVDSLKARRDFLESDVDHLEQFLGTQRGRLRDAATAMIDLTERVNGGLGEVRRPLLSAADDTASDDTAPDDAAPDDAAPDDTAPDEEPEAAASEVGDPSDDHAGEATPIDSDAIPREQVASDAQPGSDEQGLAGEAADQAAADGPETVPEFDAYANEADTADGIEPVQTGFVLDDVSGDQDRPAADEDVRFTFDERG